MERERPGPRKGFWGRATMREGGPLSACPGPALDPGVLRFKSCGMNGRVSGGQKGDSRRMQCHVQRQGMTVTQ